MDYTRQVILKSLEVVFHGSEDTIQTNDCCPNEVIMMTHEKAQTEH